MHEPAAQLAKSLAVETPAVSRVRRLIIWVWVFAAAGGRQAGCTRCAIFAQVQRQYGMLASNATIRQYGQELTEILYEGCGLRQSPHLRQK
jgi:hypothetical protein